ncbi:histone-fold-containing protein [Hysterangium stoloniferum]|nr:histone-fold-containing protein [Hysterangium stoloniferum]
MPPRSAAPPDANSDGIDNFQLPKALVTRIAKSALPHDAKLQKDTVGALVDGSTVFINYLGTVHNFVARIELNPCLTAATAHDVAESRSRKTIAAPDILKALEIIEFGDLVSLLEEELEVYRGGSKTSKGKGKATGATSKGKEKEMEITDAASEPDDEPLDTIEGQDNQDDDQPEDILEEGQETLLHDPDEPEDNLDEDEDMADPEPEEEGAEEEESELVDTIAIEEKELKKDAKGVEERGSGVVDEEDEEDDR